MDLKNTIDNTNKYKNDLKLARSKINDRILSGGGTIANTISDVPNAIDRMLGQYKKVAIGSVNVSKNLKDGDIKFTLPINFKPNIFIVRTRSDAPYADIVYHLNSKDGAQEYQIDTDGSYATFKAYVSGNTAIVNISGAKYYNTYTITDWIAIE